MSSSNRNSFPMARAPSGMVSTASIDGLAKRGARLRKRSLQLFEKARLKIVPSFDNSSKTSKYAKDSPRSVVSTTSSPFKSMFKLERTKSPSPLVQFSRDDSPSPLSSTDQILFYHKDEPYYGFTNFSPHTVRYDGKLYPTSEHLFQSFKFAIHKPNLAEHIRTCDPRPSKAFSEARRFQPEVRQDWRRVHIQLMEIALWHKFNQHPDLQSQLLDTGNATLIENSDKDAFWGIGQDGKGRNELGKALERLRERLRT